MYFHAGQDFVLNTRDVIGVFDLDTAGASCRTEEYFRSAEDNGAVTSSLRPVTASISTIVWATSSARPTTRRAMSAVPTGPRCARA